MTAVEAAADAQQRLIKALTARDAAALDRLLTQDAFWIHASSAKDNKQSLIDSVLSGAVFYRSIALSEVETREAPGAFVFVGKAKITALAHARRTVAAVRFTSLWVERDGQWQLLGWQATALPA